MTLEDLGYNANLENYRKEHKLCSFDMGRIISEHKERYVVKTEKNEFDAEIIGNLRFSAKNRSDFPAVGDWVSISEYDKNKALIYNIFPRKTIIERQTAGKIGEKQIIATNVDYAFIVQSTDRDFNINRLERYLTICYTSNIKPIILLSKIDLINKSQLKNIHDTINKRVKHVPIIAFSNETHTGFSEIISIIESGKTYCLLGSSGVGKSTLLNNLLGKTLMNTDSISLSTKKGKHVTSHRELIILENGGILIDNPGMREIGIADANTGLEMTFNSIIELSQKCKFRNCKHIQESGCAVIQAVKNGKIDKASYENYLKMEKEKAHFELTLVEKRKKDKEFGKLIKKYKKDMKLNNS
ncbi:MAG: ribosome small subunit-dependent GTPase A [Bacteroidales bacterium]|nr:ribosome small subunit-dependent GTPase A [Bacteroidales bacterium]